MHIKAGAKVIISAPSKSEDVKTIVYGVNENILNGDETVQCCIMHDKLPCSCSKSNS